MKNMYKAMLLVTLGLASATAVKAANGSGGDLIVGFTGSSGTDVYYDLGSATTLTSGETWDLTTALTAAGLNTGTPLATAQWGVLGDNATLVGGVKNTWASTGDGSMPQEINGANGYNALQIPVNSILNNLFGGAGSHTAGTFATDVASDGNSWASQSLPSATATSWYNEYGGISANVTGTGVSDQLFEIADNNTPATLLGGFTLGSNDQLTFTAAAVPEPSTYGMLAGAGLLVLAVRNQFRRKLV